MAWCKCKRFKQQQLPAHTPQFTFTTTLFIFLILGCVFVAVGIAVLIITAGVVETTPVAYHDIAECKAALRRSRCYTTQHDGEVPLAIKDGTPMDPLCDRNATQLHDNECTVPIVVPKDMEPPIFVYYQLSGLWQNHRRYIKSRSDAQLRGEVFETYQTYTDAMKKECGEGADRCTNGTLPVKEVPGRFWCNPCGLVARSFFTDTFTLEAPAGGVVPWTQEGTVWEGDLAHKYLRSESTEAYNTRTPAEDSLVTDPDFINWMRPAALPEFRKLYRIIPERLSAGVYVLTVRNNYDMEYFGGKKAFVMTTVSSLGGKHGRTGTMYIIVGVACFVLAAVMTVLEFACGRKQKGHQP